MVVQRILRLLLRLLKIAALLTTPLLVVLILPLVALILLLAILALHAVLILLLATNKLLLQQSRLSTLQAESAFLCYLAWVTQSLSRFLHPCQQPPESVLGGCRTCLHSSLFSFKLVKRHFEIDTGIASCFSAF